MHSHSDQRKVMMKRVFLICKKKKKIEALKSE